MLNLSIVPSPKKKKKKEQSKDERDKRKVGKKKEEKIKKKTSGVCLDRKITLFHFSNQGANMIFANTFHFSGN